MTGTTDTPRVTDTPQAPAARGQRQVSRRTALKGAAALTAGAVGLTT